MYKMKRLLTNKEIEFILSDIKPVPCVSQAVATCTFDKVYDSLYKELETVELYESAIPLMREKITNHYYKTQIPAGESVGILTAQSIGERQTQLVLNTFHSAGITIATAVTGIPRFSELLNATKNPRNVITTIYFRKKIDSIQRARSIGQRILESKIKHVATHITKCREEKWYDLYFRLNNVKPFTPICRLHFDKEQLYRRGVQLWDVALLLSRMSISAVPSPQHLGFIDIALSRKSILKQLYDVRVKGIADIQDMDYTNVNNEWNIQALGSNLLTLLSVDEIDATRTISNNMWEIYQVLGIEATRQFLIEEFTAVICTDAFINARHITLLVDVMLYSGSIMSVSRYGMNQAQAGPLSRCSFEESLDQILKAGVYAETENLKGVSASIICGKVSQVGSGLCDVLLI